MIEVNNLSFARGNTLIYKNINFKIRPGELLLIQGANGVGKTTLLSNIVNFIDPLDGNITYNNLVIDNYIASKHFLYIGEANFAHDSLTLNQNLILHLKKSFLIYHIKLQLKWWCCLLLKFLHR